jgi:hypothetical protein
MKCALGALRLQVLHSRAYLARLEAFCDRHGDSQRHSAQASKVQHSSETLTVNNWPTFKSTTGTIPFSETNQMQQETVDSRTDKVKMFVGTTGR